MIIIKPIIDNINPNMADFFFSDFKPFIPKTIPIMEEIKDRGAATINNITAIRLTAPGSLKDKENVATKDRKNITTEIILIIPHINDIDAFLWASGLVC